MDSRVNPVRERLDHVRQALARHGAHALLVPSADPHLSEYLPGRWQGRQWLSGFTGSMATLVVTADRAALFADSRYWQQASIELLGSGIFIINPPHTLVPALREALPLLVRLLGQFAGAGHRLESAGI